MAGNRRIPNIAAVVIFLAPTVDAFTANARAFTAACALRRTDAGLRGIRSPCVLSVSATGSDHPSSPRMPIGRITSLDRSKIDTGADARFYAAPRLVTHADDKWIAQLQALYRERIPQDAVILDLMGSHISHLPEDVPYARVDVHGMNEVELTSNTALQASGGRYFTHDLNLDPSLSFIKDAACYDAVLCALGVQYLQEPELVFAEARRVLKPSGIVIVSFSSNFFYEKALSGWIDRGMRGRSRLVKDYFRAAGGFDKIEEVGSGGGIVGTLASILPGNAAGDPFGAVVAVPGLDDAPRGQDN